MYIQLFVANQNKPPEIAGILVTNKSKILRFLADFTLDKGNNNLYLNCLSSR